MRQRITFLLRLLGDSSPRYFLALKWLLILTAIAITLGIALLTPFNVHPDEVMHIDGFRYFQGRFFPPNIGSNEVVYDIYGFSRVYYQELVYIIYGNIANLLKTLFGVEPGFLIYRLLNIGLLFITLRTLFFTELKSIRLEWFGFLFVCIPQICYIYAYANSDAWALSISLFLFIISVKLWEKSVEEWNIQDFLILGILTGLTLVAKLNFLVGLIIPYGLIGVKLFQDRFSFIHKKRWGIKIFAWCLSVVIIMAPLRIIYPMTQGNFWAAMTQMRQERAIQALKPSNLTINDRFQMGKEGYTHLDLLTKTEWFETTAKSFWGLYGYMRVYNPDLIYRIILYCGFGLLALTGFTFLKEKLFQNLFFVVCLMLSLFTILANGLISLEISLEIFQPQGRYLLASFFAIAFLLIGTTSYDKPDILRSKKLLLLITYSLTIYSLIVICLPRLTFIKQLF